jgi:hypothetical protein
VSLSSAHQTVSRVLLVYSVHRETGAATAGELHWLLGRLQPDVLFLEESSTGLPAFLDGSRGTLESAAVRRYRREYSVELIPVDLHREVTDFKPQVDVLFDRIEEASERYCQLEYANRKHTEKGGFAYLNSPICAVLQSEMQKEIRATVETVGDPAFTELYALWTRAMDMRERAMLNGVEAHADQKSFRKVLLLVGAAHRQSLIEKSQLPRSGGVSRVMWDFAWRLEDTPSADDAGSDTA